MKTCKYKLYSRELVLVFYLIGNILWHIWIILQFSRNSSGNRVTSLVYVSLIASKIFLRFLLYSLSYIFISISNAIISVDVLWFPFSSLSTETGHLERSRSFSAWFLAKIFRMGICFLIKIIRFYMCFFPYVLSINRFLSLVIDLNLFSYKIFMI